MKLGDVGLTLNAEVLYGESCLDREVSTVCGADLMSDVLRFTKYNTLLLTGLTNIQVIRTAEISDLVAIVFVRGKKPSSEVLLLAREKRIPILLTPYTLYEACGLLYTHGLRSSYEVQYE